MINTLAQMRFVTTVRGRRGGLRLARPARDIHVGEVTRAFEMPVPFAECFSEASNTCPLLGNCRLRAALKAALDAFYASLDRVSLRERVDCNDGLTQLLSLPPVAPPPCREARKRNAGRGYSAASP